MAQQMVFQAAHAAGFKVLLGGQGGDEAFMGYHKFQAFYLRSLLARKRYLDALVFAITLMPTFLAERAIWAESWRNRFRYSQSSGFGTRLRLPEAELMIGHSPLAALRDRQMLDVTLASLPTLLRYEDSNSMGNSIESRLPLLDYRLVEVGLALPESFKLRGGRGKWILREAAKQRIPESIRLARFKKGFDVQQNAWIEGGLGDRIRELLRGQLPTVGEFLAPGVEIEAVFSDTELKYRPSAFVEANTLLWIADSLQAA
jgi:asparagine synthase (glutamine-hydrolysing)